MSSHPIPSVFRQPRSELKALPGSRPRSLAELSEIATKRAAQGLQVDSAIPITRYLIGSETLTRQAESCLNQGDLEEAFIALVKNCKLLIEVLPSQHRGYKTLDSETKKKLKQKGQWNLDQLSQVKGQLVDRFEAWRRANPNASLEPVVTEPLPPQPKPSRPVPSTGNMLQDGGADSTRSIEYVKPNRTDVGFDVRDILSPSSKSGSLRMAGSRANPSSSIAMPSPFTSSPLQPFSHAHSVQRNLSSGINYPSLRPAQSIRMNDHQVSQGFAPRSENTYRYYQIQTPSSSSSTSRQAPSFPTPEPANRRLARPMPMPSPSQPHLGFNYPSISHSESLRRSNTAPAPAAALVEEEARRLLHGEHNPNSSSRLSIAGATTEGGEPLRTLILPASLISTFVRIAEPNTTANLETCGLLMGTIEPNMLQVTHLLIPKQTATSDRCDTQEEEEIWSFMDSKGLVTLGWCHTHPQQSCFMSSLDLHTHSAYQATLPEAIAIVCAPHDEPSFGLFRLTSPFGLQMILSCRQPGLFHPHVTDSGQTIEAIYTDAVNGHVILTDAPLAITDLRC